MTRFTAAARRIAGDILHAIYPESCLACETEIERTPSALCGVCESELHFTRFEKRSDATELDKLFWGRIRIEKTFALLFFSTESSTQKILHTLKYKDRPDVAVYFGKQTGLQMTHLPELLTADALVPVPLHSRKKFIRGYNQSERLAAGIAAVTGIPVDESLLRRVAFSESQTRKDKASRWENMQGRFRSGNNRRQLKHVILVDDVVTTGSTLESCANMLHKNYPGLKISVVALAMAR